MGLIPKVCYQKDDYYEFASFIDAILPFLDASKIVAAQELKVIEPQSHNNTDDSKDNLEEDNDGYRSANQSRPRSGVSRRSKSTKSNATSRQGSGRKSTAEGEKEIPNNRLKPPCQYCWSFAAWLC